ncbi:MAG: hypothetical protein JXR80_03070 [Deltaproteobacteria bacterium]|nr:hypothetical protein [Deltaproteobacteria bacterium]
MNHQPRRQARLNLRNDLSFLPTVQTFIENTALTFGLGHAEALALTLAGEEIFNYLCSSVKPQTEIEISCHEGGYYAALHFSLPIHNFAMRAFNLTATIDLEDEKSLDEMGLLIASRMVDYLRIGQNESGRLQLLLRKEKSYPQAAANIFPPGAPISDQFTIISPEAEELKFFINACRRGTAADRLPPEFDYPGKVVDMVNSGDFRAAIARDHTGHIGGGIIWFWSSNKMVECHGPYILAPAADPHPAMAPALRQALSEALLEHCLNAIAKSPAVGLLNRAPGPDLPRHHFESLGTVSEYRSGAPALEIPALLRQMQEDPGAVAWAHPDLEPFLRRHYQRLTLPREIRLTSESGEATTAFSVLATDFDRPRQKVTLRPLWAGTDMAKNIADHLAIFAEEELNNIFFVLDLGQSWQAAFFPALTQNGFTPRLLLPYGGTGDLLVLQKTGVPA